jgi:hypothetical protein
MGHTSFLAYPDDVNIVGENTDNIKKNTEALLDAIKAVGLEENPEKTTYMLKSHIQKIGRRHSIKIGNRSFEDVGKVKYPEQQKQIQIASTKRLRAEYIPGMLATIRFRVFCPPANRLST